MFVAEDVRKIMSELGFRKFDEMVGRIEALRCRTAIDHWKSRGLDLSAIFAKPDASDGRAIRCIGKQSDTLKTNLDWQILKKVDQAIETKEKVDIELPISNVHRTVGTILSNRIVSKHGAKGLEDDTIAVTLTGSAGQSFGAFLISGVTLRLIGDSNDYLGKGLSGGRIVVQTPPQSPFEAHENIIVGNTLLYGAIDGEVFINGRAGERFAVRNSGAEAVVEGVGDHGCEYMTGGTVVVLGRTGRNFAAGMSGGVAYVLDEHQLFDTLCNLDMVDLENVWHKEDKEVLGDLIRRHHNWTASARAKSILDNWRATVGKFVKVIPIDYRRALANMGFTEIRALEPGQMIIIENGKLRVEQFAGYNNRARCFFEWVYFSNVASEIDGCSVYKSRVDAGGRLAEMEDQSMDEDCIVVPVPDTAKAAADSFAYHMKIPCVEGLIRNRYVGRTFIQPNSTRSHSARSKYTPLPSVLAGKRVFLLEDSIVRSTTLRALVDQVRNRGHARQVHVRVACPPIISPCFYGIDMSTLGELFAQQFVPTRYNGCPKGQMLNKMAKTLGVDSLKYLSVQDLGPSIGCEANSLCLGCVTGKYPTDWGNKLMGLGRRKHKEGLSTRTYE